MVGGKTAKSREVLARIDVAHIFQSLGEFIAIHEPVLDEYGTLVDARLIWWNDEYENVRVTTVEANSLLMETYIDPGNALTFASAAWSSGRALQVFDFTPDKLGQYRPPGEILQLSVVWERVGDFIVEVGSDLSTVRRLEDKLADQRSLVFTTERDRALVSERERIARNLHDSVIQQIYAASLGLNVVASRLAGESIEPADTLDRSSEVVKSIADNLSALIATIRNEIFDVTYDGVPSLTRDLDDVVLPLIGPTAIEFLSQVHVDSLDNADVVTHLRAVVRETVSNAVRHSGCTWIMLSLHRSVDDRLHLVVADNGVGLPENLERSSGLTNIVDRAKALGGSAEFMANASGGTSVSWIVPVPEWRR